MRWTLYTWVRSSNPGAGQRDSFSFSGSSDTDVDPQTTTYHIHNIAPASRSYCPLRNYPMGATNIIYVSDCECLSVSIAAAICCDSLSSWVRRGFRPRGVLSRCSGLRIFKHMLTHRRYTCDDVVQHRPNRFLPHVARDVDTSKNWTEKPNVLFSPRTRLADEREPV